MKPILVSGLALAIAGCSALQPKDRCRELGCIESAPMQDAPVGAELSFSQCNGRVLYSYTYRRESNGWSLRSYGEKQSTLCDGSP